jgi:hypothetical protein
VTVKTLDLAWAAGFLEGEGSFGTTNGLSRTPHVTCPQVQREPLERLQQIFGLGHIYRREGRIWTWQQSGQHAAAIMMTIYTLMSPWRQEQIEKALEVWRTRPAKLVKGWSWRPRAGGGRVAVSVPSSVFLRRQARREAI